MLLRYPADHDGRVCPRVLLDPDNSEAWELLPLLASESVAFSSVFGLMTADMEPDDALAMLRRVYYAMGHPDFREAKKAAEQAKARQEQAKR